MTVLEVEAMETKNSRRKNVDLDKLIGERIRIRRLLMNVTQNELAKHLGITFQQIQKYENGKNRVSASTLYQISKKLCAPISYFFGIGSIDSGITIGQFKDSCGDSGDESTYEADINSSDESVELLKGYYSIEDQNTRKHIFEIIKRFQG